MPYVSKLIAEISSQDIFQSKFLNDVYNNLSIDEKKSFNEIIGYFFEMGYDIDYLVKSYLLIVNDTMAEQKYFFDNKKYRYSTYAEVEGHVYNAPEYMHMYMTGLALTKYLWYTHRQIMRWYSGKIRNIKTENYLEIGPGHGDYFSESVLNMDCNNFTAVDISPTSIEMTKKFAAHKLQKHNVLKNYEIICSDFLNFPTEKLFDAIIMGEVLEHVENPCAFLTKIRDLATDNAFIYITTVINAPAIDHIYLFNDLEELFSLIKNSGMNVKDYLPVTAQESISLEKALRKRYPVSIALTLEKA